MTINRVEAGRGWEWIVEGWRLFLKAPGVWLLMLLIFLGIGIVLHLIPFVGVLAWGLVAPALSGGLVSGAAALARGEELTIERLFHAFQDQPRLGSLLTLGALVLASYVIIILLGGFLVAGVIVGGNLSLEQLDERLIGMLAGGGLVIVLLMLLVILAVSLALLYAIPLVMLGNASPIHAAKLSLAACAVNFMPLLVFSLIYLALSVLAMVPLGLGLLVLAPVTVGAVYTSYIDIFDGRNFSGET